MSYQIKPVSPELVYIKWYANTDPRGKAEATFIADLTACLNQAPHPIYFISDVRAGRITDVGTLSQLANLTRHKNWAGSTAFAQNPLSAIFVSTFASLAKKGREHQEMQDTPGDALAYLESLKPGITNGIDWQSVLE